MCCIAFEGKLWAIGGYDGHHASQVVEIYDPAEDAWTPGPRLLEKRSVVVCAVLNGRIYAVGGYDGKHYLKTMEIYDPKLGAWVHGPEMSTPRGRHCVCTLPWGPTVRRDCMVSAMPGAVPGGVPVRGIEGAAEAADGQ